MGRKKKVIPLDVIKELGKPINVDKGSDEYLTFIDTHLKKFNTIAKAETLLWNMNISLAHLNIKLYDRIFEHTKGFNFKNQLTEKRHDMLEAFIWDNTKIN